MNDEKMSPQRRLMAIWQPGDTVTIQAVSAASASCARLLWRFWTARFSQGEGGAMMREWLCRRCRERQIIGRIYYALALLDTRPETARELIEGIHSLRYQARGAYQGLYGHTPEHDGYGDREVG